MFLALLAAGCGGGGRVPPGAAPPAPAARAGPGAAAASPCAFSGAARAALAPAADGTPVEAWVEGRKAGEAAVTGGRYHLVLGPEYADKTVTFRFPTYPQLGEAGRSVCLAGKELAVDLDAQAHQGCGGA